MLPALIAATLLAAAQPVATDPFELVAVARSHLEGSARDLWPGWDETPFGLVLVGETEERLVCDGRAPEGFGNETAEPVTGCQVRSRPRTFPTGLLAAMPVFGPPSVVVVGEPALTGQDDHSWTLTLLHEHFHQHQTASPDYWARVEALDLSGGDQTGMWMLTYPFAYDDLQVASAAHTAAGALAALLDRDAAPTADDVAAYLAARRALAATVTARDWRYAEFQMWQEGVARWTEIAAAQSFDDQAYQEAGRSRRRTVLDELATLDLTEDQRLVFYALGAGEAELLERCGTDWQAHYFDQMELGPLLVTATETCEA